MGEGRGKAQRRVYEPGAGIACFLPRGRKLENAPSNDQTYAA